MLAFPRINHNFSSPNVSALVYRFVVTIETTKLLKSSSMSRQQYGCLGAQMIGEEICSFCLSRVRKFDRVSSVA